MSYDYKISKNRVDEILSSKTEIVKKIEYRKMILNLHIQME